MTYNTQFIRNKTDCGITEAILIKRLVYIFTLVCNVYINIVVVIEIIIIIIYYVVMIIIIIVGSM